MPTSSGPRLFIALMHHPVTNKNGDVICSAVTNLDIHDISRAARTYGVERYFIVTPVEDQQVLAGRIISHWVTGAGSAYNPKREQALSIVEVVDSLDDAVDKVESLTGVRPKTVVTDARPRAQSMSYESMAQRLKGGEPHILIFGTAWGLTDDFIEKADFVLDPVRGNSDYNHLSVRSAAAIILDRLLGDGAE